VRTSGIDLIEASSSASSRRHDLDALRAFAMLLGIVLHGMMSFIPGIGAIWAVEDSHAGPWYGVLLSFIHGWRMPLFFLVSGFFTAMLWRKRGLRELISHRFKRIFIPMLLALTTIIPLTWVVSGYVRSQATASVTADRGGAENAIQTPASEIKIWGDVATADQAAVEKYLSHGGDVQLRDPNGATPLHVACFFGRANIAGLLLKSDASLIALNNEGKRPDELLLIDWETTAYIANFLQVPAERIDVLKGREAIATLISERTGRKIASLPIDSEDPVRLSSIVNLLMYFPLFGHLWFLWFLCWYVCVFALLVKLLQVFPIPGVSPRLILSARRFLWLVPLTAVPQYLMARTPGAFGPDTSVGILPFPAVFAYYALFFGFGVLYFDADDRDVAVGRGFWWMLTGAAILLFPLGLSLQGSTAEGAIIASSIVQVCFAWVMSFGMIGLFHRHFKEHTSWLRYLSDSAYWLYLAHIPLIIYIQHLVRDLPLLSGIKVVIIFVATTSMLLLSYHFLVRNTWLGVLLNGRRHSQPSPDREERMIVLAPQNEGEFN
jgi:peptidoglycan/LPS O-acetylase OafA/YrhL